MPDLVTFQGDKQLAELFDELPKRAVKITLRRAMTAAAKPTVDVARGMARVESGLLRKSLGAKIKTYSDTNTVVAIIGPMKRVVGIWPHGRKSPKRWPAKYAHIVEKLYPFLKPSFEATKGQDLQIATEVINKSVTEEAKALGFIPPTQT